MREGGEEPDRAASGHEAEQAGPEHDVVEHGGDAGRVAELQLGEAEAHGEAGNFAGAGDRGNDDLHDHAQHGAIGDLRDAGINRGNGVAGEGREIWQPHGQSRRKCRGEDGFYHGGNHRGAVNGGGEEQAGDAQKRPEEMAEPEEDAGLAQDHD
jgi:hypothetical protein